VPGCRECPALTAVPDGCSEHRRESCAPGEELLRLVTELWEGVSRVRSIREAEKGIDYRNSTLPSLGQACQAEKTHGMEDSLSSLCPTERRDLWHSGRW